jgi:glucosamine--fructose-6-phosphate aminotransferase (isomerizing)
MRQEIEQQPEALARTIDALRPLAAEIRSVGGPARHLLFLARGTSDNAAVYGQYLCSTRTGRLATLGSPSVATAYRARVDLTDVLAVGLSQSGDTAEIVESLDWAGSCGARTIAVTNQPGSRLAQVADLALVTLAGEERAVPATKTYTTQLAALAVLAFSLADDRAALDALDDVPEAAQRLLASAESAERLAAGLTGADRMVVSARGYAASAALELALKLKEACYVTAVGMSYADLVHGPIAIVERSTPVILLSARRDDAVLGDMTSLARRCASAGAHVYGVGGDDAFARACRAVLPGPDLPAELAPIPLIVPGQLLTEALARVKGIDPDAPRGLTKVTQTEPSP